MNEILQTPGQGLEFDKTGFNLTTSWLPDPNVQKTEEGIYIDELAIAQNIKGKIDGHTIVLTGLDEERNGLLGINHDVVVCCYSMCQNVVTNRSSVESYAVDIERIKSIDDIINEINAVFNSYKESGKNVPTGMPVVRYRITSGDMLTLRRGFVADQLKIGNELWPVAVENMNRFETDEIRALFYVEKASWSVDSKLEKLSLLCLWSELKTFVNGERYQATA